MKKHIALFIALILTLSLFAEENTSVETWKNGGMGAMQFSQAAMKNWMAGGENALALNLNFNYFMNYQQDKMTWKNNLDLGYGLQIKSGESQKTDDRVDFASNFGYEAAKKWYYSGMVSFKTQMAGGYADTVKISGFMAPAYMLFSLGMKYEPCEKFSLMISPVTGKMTLVLDPVLSTAGVFGVDPGKSMRAELGAYAKLGFNANVMKNIKFDTKCEFFVNYVGTPFSVDVNWDMMLAMKINELISANISTQLIYDLDVSPDIQFKEVFTFGLSYSF